MPHLAHPLAAIALLGMAIAAGAHAEDLIPVERIPPDYPSAALALDLEAACLVTFDILNNGETADVSTCCRAGFSGDPARPLDPAIGGLFAPPTVAAVLRWRYSTAPGEPLAIQREGVDSVLEYQLYDDSEAADAPRASFVSPPASCTEEPIA